MKIVSVGPVLGKKDDPSSKIVISVEDDEGNHFRIRFYHSLALRAGAEGLKTIIRNMLSIRRSPGKEFAGFKDVEL
jgi:hypothetical protein